MKISRVVIAGLLVVTSLGSLGYFGLRLLTAASCDNELLSETVSPDHEYKAVVFVRNCGATSAYSTQVSVLKTGDFVGNDAGNAFTSDGNHGIAADGPGGGPVVRAKWTARRNIMIEHDSDARVFHAEPVVGEVNVTYTKLSREEVSNPPLSRTAARPLN